MWSYTFEFMRKYAASLANKLPQWKKIEAEAAKLRVETSHLEEDLAAKKTRPSDHVLLPDVRALALPALVKLSEDAGNAIVGVMAIALHSEMSALLKNATSDVDKANYTQACKTLESVASKLSLPFLASFSKTAVFLDSAAFNAAQELFTKALILISRNSTNNNGDLASLALDYLRSYRLFMIELHRNVWFGPTAYPREDFNATSTGKQSKGEVQ